MVRGGLNGRRTAGPCTLRVIAGAGVLLAALGLAPAALAQTRIVRAGDARFEVLTPTLVRLEYSADGTFENRPTMTAVDRDEPVPPYTTAVKLGVLTIRTAAFTLYYLEHSGPFTPANTSISLHVGGVDGTVAPVWNPCADIASLCAATNGTPGSEVDGGAAAEAALGAPPPCSLISGLPEIGGTLGGALAAVPDGCTAADGTYTNLAGADQRLASLVGGDDAERDITTNGQAIGGYTREAEDVEDQRPPLHAGFLRTSGWYLLDDTSTAILTTPTTAIARPKPLGPYQDGYFFAYGHDYAHGLRDFAELTGPAPLLPEWAFGPLTGPRSWVHLL